MALLRRSIAPLGVALLGCVGSIELAAAQRLVVRPERGTPVVATELLVAAGPADGTADQAGIAYLAARALVAPVRPLLDSLGASLVVGARKDAVSFTLVSAPDAWPDASRALLVALFRDPVDSLALEGERRLIRRELLGREANPADVLRAELDAAFWGPNHPWARPAAGSPATVDSLDWAAADDFVRAAFLPERTVAAVVGSVDSVRALEHLRNFLRGSSLAVPSVPAADPADTAVWRNYNTITTWIGAAYAFPLDADIDALRALAMLVADALAPGPGRRSIYNVRSEIVLRPGGGELRFQLVVPPAEAERWGEELQRQVEEAVAVSELEFWNRARRYRGRRLLDLDSPEARAEELADRLLLGRAPDASIRAEHVTQARVRAVLRRLQRPALVFLGPELEAAQ